MFPLRLQYEQMFHPHKAGHGPQEKSAAVDVKITDDLEFDTENGREFVRALLELVVQDSPLLVYKAVRLLFRHFSKHEELLQSVTQVQLLVSQQDVDNHAAMKEAIDNLRIVLDTRIDRKKKFAPRPSCL